MKQQIPQAVSIARTPDAVSRLNLLLIFASVCALMYFVIAANHVAAQAWRMADAQDQLGKLVEARNSLVSQQSAFEDRSHLTALAADVGMVPAEGVSYLVEEQSVAAR